MKKPSLMARLLYLRLSLDANLLDGAFSSADEMHDRRDDREQDKQMDKKAGYMQAYEETQPEHYQYHCKNQKHSSSYFLDAKNCPALRANYSV